MTDIEKASAVFEGLSPYWRRRVMRRAISRAIRTDWYKNATPSVRKKLLIEEYNRAMRYFQEHVWKND